MHAVMHIVDCARSCSVLWKVVANKEDLVDKLHYVDADVEVVIMTKCEGTWVLAAAKAVLDVVLSVAASIILSLLLLSGDVEENPGPLGGKIRFLKIFRVRLHNILIFILMQIWITTVLIIVRQY